ncbi:MAG: hypothetical protein ACREPM_12020 [Gemmatimonadaceae bacterium]
MKLATMITALAFAPSLVIAQSTKPPRGTIAVIPFGAGGAAMMETSAAFAVAVENALQTSGRFVAVLPRSGDAAIRAELGKSTEPANLGSLVKIAQDAQLNANYVLSGWVVGQDVKSNRDQQGQYSYQAEARVLVRIIDVSNGAMVVSEIVVVSSGGTLDACADGFRGHLCDAGNSMKRNEAYSTQVEALSSLRTNGYLQLELQKVLTQKFGYVVVDVIEEGGQSQLVLRATAGDPKKGTKLQAVQARASSLGNGTYNTLLGKLEVTDMSGETATATIIEGADKIVKAVKEQQTVVLILKS